MSDDRWASESDEPENDANEDVRPRADGVDYRTQPLAPLTQPMQPRPRYGRTTLPDTRRVTGDDVDAFLDRYCAEFGIDRNGRPVRTPAG